MGLEVKAANSKVLFCSAQFALLAACFLLVSCLAYSSALKIERVRPSETSVNYYWAAQLYMQEDNILHSHSIEPQLQHKINLYLLC
jgi:hypothetical protein